MGVRLILEYVSKYFDNMTLLKKRRYKLQHEYKISIFTKVHKLIGLLFFKTYYLILSQSNKEPFTAERVYVTVSLWKQGFLQTLPRPINEDSSASATPHCLLSAETLMPLWSPDEEGNATLKVRVFIREMYIVHENWGTICWSVLAFDYTEGKGGLTVCHFSKAGNPILCPILCIYNFYVNCHL